MKKVFFLNKFFIISALFLMPIDYFYPTALIFREAGAKPFNLYVLLYLFVYLLLKGRIHFRYFKSESNFYLILILFLGIIAFILNSSLVYYPPNNRSPEIQFIFQTLIFILFIVIFNGLRIYFFNNEFRKSVLNMIPIVVLLHLIIFGLEFFEFINANDPGIIIYFRNNAGLIDRASGLMSEPSYFGVFSGIFILPLIFICKKYRILNIVMSATLFIASVIIQAKTFFIVIFPQVIFLIFSKERSRKIKIVIGLLTVLLAAMAIYTINTSKVIDFQQNLSSANRIGSGILGLNVAISGFGLLGLGFGQFHFFYLPEYSPDFLFLSQEALDQMNNVNDSRASTFSLPIRVLVETGVLGVIAYLTFVIKLFKNFSASKDPITQLGLLFIMGSIGFLLTQDSYCLPSLVFGLALVTTERTGPGKISSK